MATHDNDNPSTEGVDETRRKFLRRSAYVAPALVALGASGVKAQATLPSPCGDPTTPGCTLAPNSVDEDPLLESVVEEQGNG